MFRTIVRLLKSRVFSRECLWDVVVLCMCRWVNGWLHVNTVVRIERRGKVDTPHGLLTMSGM